MKNATKSWLASLAVNTIVLWEQEEGSWAQAAIVKIHSDDPATSDTPIEIQPEFDPTTIVRAGDLRPVTTIKVSVSIELEVTLGQETPEEFGENLRANIESAISQGMLTIDSDSTVEKHEMKLASYSADKLFTDEQREEVIVALCDDMVDSLTTDADYAFSVARKGHRHGYDSCTDTALLTEHEEQLGSLADNFEWAEDGQFVVSDEDYE